MLAEARPDHPADFASASHVAGRLEVNPETLRLQRKRANIDAGHEPGSRSVALVQIQRLRKQITESEMSAPTENRATLVWFSRGAVVAG